MSNSNEDNNNTEEYNSDVEWDSDGEEGEMEEIDDYIQSSEIIGSINNLIINYVKDKDDIDEALLEVKNKLKKTLNNN